MSTFYDAPNDYRNYLCHYGVKGMKWRKRIGQTLREHRLEQARKVINGEQMSGEHEDRIRQQQEYQSRNRRSNENHHEDNTAQDRRRQQEEIFNSAREEKIREEQEWREHQEAEREHNRKRNIAPTGLSGLKEFSRARVNKYKLQKIYNTRVSGSHRH
jgi:hypothetical protein